MQNDTISNELKEIRAELRGIRAQRVWLDEDVEATNFYLLATGRLPMTSDTWNTRGEFNAEVTLRPRELFTEAPLVIVSLYDFKCNKQTSVPYSNSKMWVGATITRVESTPEKLRVFFTAFGLDSGIYSITLTVLGKSAYEFEDGKGEGVDGHGKHLFDSVITQDGGFL